MSKKDQIQWLIDYHYEHRDQSFSPSNAAMEGEFIKAHSELSYRLWKDRVRLAAKEMGFSPKRLKNMSPGYRPAGDPAYFIVYS